ATSATRRAAPSAAIRSDSDPSTRTRARTPPAAADNVTSSITPVPSRNESVDAATGPVGADTTATWSPERSPGGNRPGSNSRPTAACPSAKPAGEPSWLATNSPPGTSGTAAGRPSTLALSAAAMNATPLAGTSFTAARSSALMGLPTATGRRTTRTIRRSSDPAFIVANNNAPNRAANRPAAISGYDRRADPTEAPARLAAGWSGAERRREAEAANADLSLPLRWDIERLDLGHPHRHGRRTLRDQAEVTPTGGTLGRPRHAPQRRGRYLVGRLGLTGRRPGPHMGTVAVVPRDVRVRRPSRAVAHLYGAVPGLPAHLFQCGRDRHPHPRDLCACGPGRRVTFQPQRCWIVHI